MAEQTRIKNQTSQDKYLEELSETEAYKLLRFVFLHGNVTFGTELSKVIAHFLDTGIVESKLGRDYFLNG